MSRTLILPGLILVAVGLLWRWSGPLRLSRGATSSWSVFILESRHTRTLDEPGKARPEHAIREQFVKLTRAANANVGPNNYKREGLRFTP
jgi:hypothetical protein